MMARRASRGPWPGTKPRPFSNAGHPTQELGRGCTVSVSFTRVHVVVGVDRQDVPFVYRHEIPEVQLAATEDLVVDGSPAVLADHHLGAQLHRGTGTRGHHPPDRLRVVVAHLVRDLQPADGGGQGLSGDMDAIVGGLPVEDERGDGVAPPTTQRSVVEEAAETVLQHPEGLAGDDGHAITPARRWP